MKFLPLLALLISPFVSALTLDDLQQRFTEQPVIRAHFDQTRTIKDLPQPLLWPQLQVNEGEKSQACSAFNLSNDRPI
ncbi:hypothetical protein OFN42_29060, partial [Escherichia coli]|nr:hypothetical protein [Escherichia coli]